MSFSVTNLGTATSTSGGTSALTVPAGGVPAGATIVAIVDDKGQTAAVGSIADSAGNTYTAPVTQQVNQAGSGIGFGTLFRAWNVAALTSGQTITYTKPVTGSRCAISYVYVTGARTASDPIDSGATASNSGTSGNPSVVSGTPTTASCFFIAFVAKSGNSGSTTQDTGHGWAAPPNAASSGSSSTDASVYAGSQVLAGTSTLTYAPTLGSSSPWAAIVVALMPPPPFFGQQVFSNPPRAQHEPDLRTWVQSFNPNLSAATNVFLVGVSSTAAAGSFGPEVDIPLVGVSATAAAGSFVPEVDVPLTGVSATAAAGSFQTTVTSPIPIDWPNPARAKRTVQDFIQSTPNVLYPVATSQPTTFDWPNPLRAKRQTPGFVHPTPDALYAAKYTTGADSSKFLGYAVLAPPQGVVSSKFLGYAILQPVPFSRFPQDWPNPQVARHAPDLRTWIQPSNFSLLGVAQALIGVSSTASAGSFTPEVRVPLVGVAATAAAGSFTIQYSSSVNLVGVSATAAAGSFAPKVDVPLTGVVATAAPGAFVPGAAVNLTGVSAVAAAGQITPHAVVVSLYLPVFRLMRDDPVPAKGFMLGGPWAAQGAMMNQVAVASIMRNRDVPSRGLMSDSPVPAEGAFL